ncbi:hypothetical protein KPB05_23090 [Burkholderia gladioli]|uniref:hypothetical protein n=1 Tax=Burkholderia gladioli TaxID=28095 RepID=UPI00285DF6AF|nr:hypothetical protein [Burkholderia gladioli]MDR8090348.1 hypothetical protein [Burkholderia gladioli]
MLDGNEFDRCTFDHCRLIFCGGPFAVMGCNFAEPQIVFDGAAAAPWHSCARWAAWPARRPGSRR